MGLKIWLPLDGDLRNLGYSNITITNNGATVNTNGKIGSCYAFNGSTGYIALSGNDIFNIFTGGTQQFSIAMWVFHADATRAILFGDYGTTGGINFNIELSTGHAVRFYWNGSPDTYPSNTTIAANTWSHIALTYDGTKIQSYINGVAKGNWTGTLAAKNKTSGEFRLGRDTRSDSTAFNGRINDFRLYDHCLSAAEVKEISQGLILHYKLNTCYLTSGTNLVTNVTAGGQTTKLTDGRLGVVTSGTNADTYFTINLSENIVNGTKYHFSCDASGISEGQFWNFPLGAQNNSALPCKIYNGHNEYTFTANDINWGTNRLFMDDINRADWAHPATFYNFVLTKDATYEIKDNSGYNNNGIINGTLTFSNDTPRYSSCSSFNGIDTKIKVPNLTPSELTISFWMKRGANTGTRQFMYTAWSGITCELQTNGTPTFAVNRTNYPTITGTAITTDSGWVHYCATFDTTNGSKLYQNGVLKSSNNNITPIVYSISTNYIGYYNTYYNGQMSDFRIYCTALSAADVKQLYEVGGKIDNKDNIHTYEYNEFGANKLLKTGILKDYTVEPFLTLSDGSKWQLLMFHYVDNGNNLFTRTDAAYCNDFGLYSRLRDIDNYTYNNTYEYYVIQDNIEYRWTQTNAPATSSSPGTVTTVSGYNNPSVGLAKNGSNTYLGYNSWWGACGCWTLWQGNAIPGFGGRNCTKYLALYARVSDFKAKIANLTAYANNLIEF